MGNLLENIDNISGATILGDGTVALIVDVINLSSRQNIWNGRDCSRGAHIDPHLPVGLLLLFDGIFLLNFRLFNLILHGETAEYRNA